MGSKERAVLGIDAAWTKTEPSGVALVVESDGGWYCKGVAPSYEQFIALARGEPVDWTSRPKGSKPEVKRLLDSCLALASHDQLKVIAVDMPLSLGKITKRRCADFKVSVAFGAKGCAVHSPNSARPGLLAEKFATECKNFGFPLAVTGAPTTRGPALIEVFPHTALLKLLNLNYRFPYKVSKRNKYWKHLSPSQRKEKLVTAFNQILGSLKQHLININLDIPAADALCYFSDLKRYEDALDALICAWMGIQYLNGDCIALGDDKAAIWIPR